MTTEQCRHLMIERYPQSADDYQCTQCLEPFTVRLDSGAAPTTEAIPSNGQLEEAKDAVRSLVAYAYQSGFHELGYAPEEVLFDEIESLSRMVEQLEDTLLKLAAQRGHVETIDDRLLIIRKTIQGWLDFNAREREAEGIETNDDCHVMQPPVWPTRYVLKAWVKTIDDTLGAAAKTS